MSNTDSTKNYGGSLVCRYSIEIGQVAKAGGATLRWGYQEDSWVMTNGHGQRIILRPKDDSTFIVDIPPAGGIVFDLRGAETVARLFELTESFLRSRGTFEHAGGVVTARFLDAAGGEVLIRGINVGKLDSSWLPRIPLHSLIPRTKTDNVSPVYRSTVEMAEIVARYGASLRWSDADDGWKITNRSEQALLLMPVDDATFSLAVPPLVGFDLVVDWDGGRDQFLKTIGGFLFGAVTFQRDKGEIVVSMRAPNGEEIQLRGDAMPSA